jgi:hypothetical protein
MTIIINIKTSDDVTARNALRNIIHSLLDGSLEEGNGKLKDFSGKPIGSYYYKKEGSPEN